MADVRTYAARTVSGSVSRLPLPIRAVPAPSDEAPSLLAGRGFVVGEAREPFADPPPGAWIHHWDEEDGTASLSLARVEAGFLLRFPGEADFLLSQGGAKVEVRPADGPGDADTLSHLLLDQVLPRALAHQGHLVLHAAAVARGGTAVLLTGASGAGKSTLAAALLHRGWTVLSDDAVVVEPGSDGAVAVPTYPGLRLQPDALHLLPADAVPSGAMAHYSDKVRVTLPGAAVPVAPLSALFLLEAEDGEPPSPGPIVEPTAPAEACIALIRNSFQLDLADQDRQARQLGLASAVAERLPVFRLRYPRDFGALDRVCAAISQAAGG